MSCRFEAKCWWWRSTSCTCACRVWCYNPMLDSRSSGSMHVTLAMIETLDGAAPTVDGSHPSPSGKYWVLSTVGKPEDPPTIGTVCIGIDLCTRTLDLPNFFGVALHLFWLIWQISRLTEADCEKWRLPSEFPKCVVILGVTVTWARKQTHVILQHNVTLSNTTESMKMPSGSLGVEMTKLLHKFVNCPKSQVTFNFVR